MNARALVLSALSLAACSSYHVKTAASLSPSPLEPPPPGLAMICVLRPHSAAQLVPAVVHDNGVLVGATRGRGHFCWLAEAGAHVVKSEAGDDTDRALGSSSVDEAKLAALPDRRYFLHQTLGSLYGTGKPEWVDDATASKMLEDCPPVVLTSVPSNEGLPTGAPVGALR